jgi:hypothetical protein
MTLSQAYALEALLILILGVLHVAILLAYRHHAPPWHHRIVPWIGHVIAWTWLSHRIFYNATRDWTAVIALGLYAGTLVFSAWSCRRASYRARVGALA